jgi:hypothetical protein
MKRAKPAKLSESKFTGCKNEQNEDITLLLFHALLIYSNSYSVNLIILQITSLWSVTVGSDSDNFLPLAHLFNL